MARRALFADEGVDAVVGVVGWEGAAEAHGLCFGVGWFGGCLYVGFDGGGGGSKYLTVRS